MAQRRRTQQVPRILNCVPSQNTKNDWRFYNAADSGLLAAPAAIPEEIDLRATWWKIGDQGSTGSCVGWASADSLLRWHFIRIGRLNQNERLSVRFQWMASKETDEFITRPTTFIEAEGTSLKAALAVARRFGAVREGILPFESAALYQQDEATFYALAGQLRIAAYFNLGDDLRDWRTWLAANGPILTRLDVDQTWDEATDTKGNLDVYQPDTTRGGHAVALVGYTPDRFTVRNSWGTGWGDKGFAYASLEYASSAFTEAYGITIA
jgi:Papain family cysteine protease